MKQRLTMFFACLFLGIGMALAQSRLTGVVTSAEDGEPVVAASVKAKGLNVGTVTTSTESLLLMYRLVRSLRLPISACFPRG